MTTLPAPVSLTVARELLRQVLADWCPPPSECHPRCGCSAARARRYLTGDQT